MLRVLQKVSQACFSAKDGAEGSGTFSSSTTSNKSEYLLFPTPYPIPPYYFFSARINKHLYEFIQKNKIRYIAAIPIRPGVFRRNFFPHSLDNLESERTYLTQYSQINRL